MAKTEHKEERLAYDVPEYGRMWGLNRNASYAAANRGDWPVVRFGKLMKVPKIAGDRLLGLKEIA